MVADDGGAAGAAKVPLAQQKWKVIISGTFMLFCALAVVSFFSSTFDYGDVVIRYFLSVTSGGNSWRPCASVPLLLPFSAFVLREMPFTAASPGQC